MNNKVKRTAFIVAILLPMGITVFFFLTWVLGLPIQDGVLDGLRVEALGAVFTAGMVVLMEWIFGDFLQQEFGREQPRLDAELSAIRQELGELRQMLHALQGDDPPDVANS